MKTIPKLMSKTKLIRGYRCLKYIYLTIHHPELEAPITPEIQALFDQGNLVGKTARHYFPDGTLIDNLPWDFTGALAKTRALLATQTKTIYEAAFEYLGCYARADIIQYSNDSKRWSIYEVKSSTKVKPEHLHDVGLQTWIMAKSGLPIEKINIMHLNPECQYPDLTQLFSIVDVTDDIRQNFLKIQPKVHDIVTALYHPQIPNVDIGAHCTAPTECGFKAHCWKEKNIPTSSIFNLPGIRNRKWELYSAGIIALDDPRLNELTPLQEKMVTAYQNHLRFLDAKAIQTALLDWKFPLVFLDFETINPAIPRYDNCKPFQHTPFQFSVHIWPHPKAPLIHKEFLHDLETDPRPTLIPELLAACGDEGSIVAYFGQFEAERIQDLAFYSPKHRDQLEQLITRIVDPLPIIRDHVYDNAFNGSFSLKYVAPALLGTEHSYEKLFIKNGNDAQRAFEELISPETASARKLLLKTSLLEYCEKDTFVMVELVKWLLMIAKES